MQIVVRHGNAVDAIGIGYENGRFVNHGGNGGEATTIILGADEFISLVRGRSGASLDQIYFESNLGRKFGPFGGRGGQGFECSLEGEALHYIFGRAGKRIDQIGFGYGQQPAALPTTSTLSRSDAFGGTGGEPFDDSRDVGTWGRIATWGRITHLVVRHGKTIDAIGVGYASGKYVSHGGSGGQETTIQLLPDEFIRSVAGQSGALLDQLVLVSSKGTTYGPYGGTGGKPFHHDLRGKALRHLFGRAGARIDQIGFGYGDQPPPSALMTNPSRSRSFGGGGGDPFDDSNAIGAWGRIGAWGSVRQIIVRHGRSIDSIGLGYANGMFVSHGGTGGVETRIPLAADELITKVVGRSGASLDQITFISNAGAVYGPYGGNGGDHFEYDFSKRGLLYLFGRAGNRIDQIGFGYGDPPPPSSTTVTRSEAFGGGGGDPFDDSHDTQSWGRIQRIVVGHGKSIDSIEVTYADGTSVKHGRDGGILKEIELRAGDFITKMSGQTGASLDAITFTSNRGVDYGPYGGSGGEPFEYDLKGKALVYLFGRAGNRIDKIGFGYGDLPPELECDAYAVYRGAADGHLWTSASIEHASWSEPHKLDMGTSKLDPAHPEPPALAAIDGVLYMVHGDPKTKEMAWAGFDCDARTWSPPRSVPGHFIEGAPALAAVGTGLLCVHTGEDAKLQWSMFDPRSRTWTASVPHGHGARSSAGPAVATLGGTVYCVHKGAQDNHLYWTAFDPDNQSWTEDRQLADVTSEQPALACLDGTLYCVHRGTHPDHCLYWSVFDPSAATWSERRLVSPAIETSAGPSLAVVRGRLQCFYRGDYGPVLWSTTFDPATRTWAAEEAFGSGNQSAAAPAVVAAADVQRPFVWASDRWMTAGAAHLTDRYLRDLCIPGAHDAGAYKFTEDYLDAYSNPTVITIQRYLDKLGLAESTLDVIVKSWSKAQELDIAGQLRAGIRFFDLRVMRYRGAFHAFHGMVGVTLETILGAIRAFVAEPRRRELVMVDFSHFKNMRDGFTDGDHVALMSLIRDELGSYLVSTADITTRTFGHIVADGSRVAAFYDLDDQRVRAAGMCPRSEVYDSNSKLTSDGTSNPDALVQDSDYTVRNPVKDKLLKLGWGLTLDMGVLEESIENRFKVWTSTHDLRWLDEKCAERFVEFARTHPQPIQLITADFVERSFVPDIAIARSMASAG